MKILLIEETCEDLVAITEELLRAGHEVVPVFRVGQFPDGGSDDGMSWSNIDLVIMEPMMLLDDVPREWHQYTKNGYLTMIVYMERMCTNHEVPVIFHTVLEDGPNYILSLGKDSLTALGHSVSVVKKPCPIENLLKAISELALT